MVNKLNLKFHFQNIQDTYMGKDFIRRRITEKLDDFGQIIESSYVDTEMEGIISPVSVKTVRESAGLFHAGDLVLYAMSDLGIVGSDQTDDETGSYDHVIYDSVEYRVELVTKGFDTTEDVISKFRLSKVAS